MFSTSFTLSVHWDCPQGGTSRYCADARSLELSRTAGLTTFNVRWKAAKFPERSIWWTLFFAVAETGMPSSAAIENAFLAAEIKQILSHPSCRAGLQKPRTTPNPTHSNQTISLSKRWQERCIVSDKDAASLRRQTQPLRGYIRRRLARGACRPPSIPPFERVHAFAWERSVP